jgi:hypothetical protein
MSPRTAIKSQALSNFVAEWTEVQIPTPDVAHEYWTLYFDESVMGPGAMADVVLMLPEGNKLLYMICLHFPASNNIALSMATTSPLISEQPGSTPMATPNWWWTNS